MKYTLVLPYVHQEYYNACRATLNLPDENILAIDNTVNNLGIMRSHNLGVQRVLDNQEDWLIVCSAAMRFGEPGGEDFVAALEADNRHHWVIEAANVYGMHCIAFRREVFERIGLYDENFSPYGFDDLDLSWRIQVGFALEYSPQSGIAMWTKVPVDATDMGMAHSIHLAGLVAPAEPRLGYYLRKWGVTLAEDGGKSPPTYRTPFNDPDKPLSWWPVPPDPRSIL